MSGTKTVGEILEIMRKPIQSTEETALLKSLQLVDESGKADQPQLARLKTAEKTMQDFIVNLNIDGTFSYQKGTGAVAAVAGPSKVDSSGGVETTFSAAAVKLLIEGKSLSLDQDKIKTVLEKYMKELPKTAETYKTGEVKVFHFEGVDTNISSLLSAGTKILDAILYSTYGTSVDHSFIFDVTKLKPQTVKGNELVEKINIGHKTIKSAFCAVYNQGGLPSKSADERNLSKFIKETVFHDKDLTQNKFCDYLSSADPGFFPSSVFLKISLDHLPTEVSSRCKMSIAGNKAIRYAVLAKRFERIVAPAPPTNTAEIPAYMILASKVEKSQRIVDTLSSLASNFEAQKKMHPLNPERTTRKNFTLQLTCAIVFSLTHNGRVAMRSSIESNNIAAFQRDENIFGMKNNLGEITFPVLTNGDADFSELSVEAVKSAYGVVG